jgi:hypothetical protein
MVVRKSDPGQQLPTWNKNPKMIAEQIYHENEAIRLVKHQLDNLETTDISKTLIIIVSGY